MFPDNKAFLMKFRVGVIYLAFVSFLIFSNIFNLKNVIYGGMDATFQTVQIQSRKWAFDFKFLLEEIRNKQNIIEENIELKKQILEFNQIQVENQTLTEEFFKLQEQASIQVPDKKAFTMVQAFGVQEIYSQNPFIKVRLEEESDLPINTTVYYDRGTLFGFVKEVNRKSAKVVPFFSADLEFKISIKSLKDPNQKALLTPGVEKNTIKLERLPLDYKVDVGDIWVTTNDVEYVLPELFVGNVSRVERNEIEGFQTVYIQLPFTVSQITYLLIEG